MASFHFKNPREHCRFAKDMRKQAPRAERLVWNALRGMRNEHGLKFRRQHPLHPYVADFACIEAQLIIELDGVSHDTRRNYDQVRDAYLRKTGWRIIRFTNEDILSNLEGVIMTIVNSAKKLSMQALSNQPSPGPSRKREGR